MEFNSNKSIYLQICDELCERVLSGELNAEDRILSVREYGANVGVNPNTVMRSYERLTQQGVIYNRRGIGYFICPGAKDKILESRRKEFMEVELPEIIRRMRLLGIEDSEIQAILSGTLK